MKTSVLMDPKNSDMAIPIRIRVTGDSLTNLEIIRTTTTGTIPNRNALTVVPYIPRDVPMENPMTMAMVAPKSAPDDIPKVYGDANGLFIRFWTAVPHIANVAPAMHAISTLGSLTSHTM